MLYQDKELGRAGLGARIAARVRSTLTLKRHADLDILSLSPHLRRDLGIQDGQSGFRADGIAHR